MSKSFDAIVIGTGQSGPFLAMRLAQAGRKVAIIERHLFGGTCVNTGCIPTKTLVASARTAYVARRAAEFGVNTGPVSVDMKKVKARKDAIQKPSQEGAESRLRAANRTSRSTRPRQALWARTSSLSAMSVSPPSRSLST